MTAFLAPWRALSPTVKVALALLCVALIGVGGALFLLLPAQARTAALAARLVALQREVAQSRAAVRDLGRYRLESVERQQRLEQVTRKLPTEREIPPLYRSLYDAAASTGLAVALFQLRDVRIQDYYTEIPIAVTAEGTYHQLGAFLERIAGFPRVVTVGVLKITAVERPTVSLRAEMTLVTYVYRPVGAPPAPNPAGATPPVPPSITPPTASPVRAPTATSSTTVALEPLAPAPPAYAARGRRDPFGSVSHPRPEKAELAARRRSAIASATLTGIVRGPDGPLALVEMPDGIGYILRAGDGIEEGRLVRIGRDSVVFDVQPKLGLVGEQIVLALGPAK